MSMMSRRIVLSLSFASALSSADSTKIYAAGSGHDMFSLPETAQEVIELSGKDKPNVLYLGTATYDDEAAKDDQTSHFLQNGCKVEDLKVSWQTPTLEEISQKVRNADIVVVSGGNTLFARNRWVKLGIDKLLKEAADRGTVMAGGSAGGIAWFDGGHSDSMDPTTYKNAPGPYVSKDLNNTQLAKSWAYIRAPGLGFTPGLFCPHYDVTEGNGVLRSTSFTNTLQQHSGEKGIAVDNWGSLMINGDTCTVISRKGKTGSVSPAGTFTTNFTSGRPGAWGMTIAKDGSLQRALIPASGPCWEIFRQADYISQDNRLELAALQNPDDGVPPSGSPGNIVLV